MSDWTKGDGARIQIRFTEPIVGDVSGATSAFTVTVPEYTYVPGGTLQDVAKTAASVTAGETASDIILTMNPLERFESAAGDITVTYDGTGGLMGDGGPVEPFTVSFAPAELIPKPDQNDEEHIEISDITATGTLTRIYYTDVQSGGEHLEIVGITATGVLTHIHDI